MISLSISLFSCTSDIVSSKLNYQFRYIKTSSCNDETLTIQENEPVTILLEASCFSSSDGDKTDVTDLVVGSDNNIIIKAFVEYDKCNSICTEDCGIRFTSLTTPNLPIGRYNIILNDVYLYYFDVPSDDIKLYKDIHDTYYDDECLSNSLNS